MIRALVSLLALSSLALAAPVVATDAASCVPTSEPATAVGPAYVRAEPGAVVVPSQRYYEESYAVTVWSETNGVPGLQTTTAGGCGAPPDLVVAGSDERAFASLFFLNFGARFCVSQSSGVLLPAHYCPIVGA